MKYNFQKEMNKITNQFNNIRKKRASRWDKISSGVNSNYNNIDEKRIKKLNNLQYKLMDEFELIHNIKYVDDDYFLDYFIKNYNYYIKNTSKILDMQYDYLNTGSYIDFDNINTENDDFIDQL